MRRKCCAKTTLEEININLNIFIFRCATLPFSRIIVQLSTVIVSSFCDNIIYSSLRLHLTCSLIAICLRSFSASGFISYSKLDDEESSA